MARTLNDTSDVYDPVAEAGRDSFPASDPPSFSPMTAAGGKRSPLPDDDFAACVDGLFREVDPHLLPLPGQVHMVLVEAQAFLIDELEEWAAGRQDVSLAELVDRLSTLRAYLSEHRANIQAEGSLCDSVGTGTPYLLSHLGHLLQHHDALDTAIAAACAEFMETADENRAALRMQKHIRAISAELGTLLAVEAQLIRSQFTEPQALD